MRNRGRWGAKDTLAACRGDQLLAETPDDVSLREYPERPVVRRVIADEVSLSSPALVKYVSQVLSSSGLSVKGGQQFATYRSGE